MKRKITSYNPIWLAVICICCLFTACEVGEVNNEPESGDVKLTFTVVDNNDKEGMKLRYYLFDENGVVVPVSGTDKGMRDAVTMNNEGTISLIDKNLRDNFTVVALAYDKEVISELNDKVEVIRDPLIHVQGGLLKGDYFYGFATKKAGYNEVKVDLKRPGGQMAIELQGEADVIEAVTSVTYEPATQGTFNGDFLCDGTWGPTGDAANEFMFDETEGWIHNSVPTVSDVNNEGTLRINYKMGENSLHSTLNVTSQHGFYVASGKRTTFKLLLRKGAGELEASFVLNNEWVDNQATEDDQTQGKEEQFYYNYVTEYSFNPKVHSSAMALAGNILFVPTGTWDLNSNGTRNVRVEYWNIETKKKLGTLPMPQELGNSFTQRVFSICRLGDRLFVSHGEYVFRNRVEVYDISDMTAPRHLTYIGGEWGYLPGKEHNLIGIPYAMWGKEDKLLLLDNYKLSVYDVNSLTAANAGNIIPVKYMMIDSGAGDRERDEAGFASMPDGTLYVTDPALTNPLGLRKIDWNNVMSSTTGEVTDLIDESGLRLSGVKAKKILFFDEDVLVFSRLQDLYQITYFREVKGEGMDATNFFRPVVPQATNALLLDTPQAEGVKKVLVSGQNGKVSVVRIDKIPLTDF